MCRWPPNVNSKCPLDSRRRCSDKHVWEWSQIFTLTEIVGPGFILYWLAPFVHMTKRFSVSLSLKFHLQQCYKTQAVILNSVLSVIWYWHNMVRPVWPSSGITIITTEWTSGDSCDSGVICSVARRFRSTCFSSFRKGIAGGMGFIGFLMHFRKIAKSDYWLRHICPSVHLQIL